MSDAATASPRRRLPGVGSFVLGLASLAWGIAAQHDASAPWLMHPEHPWHWWVQAAFFFGIAVGRWAQVVAK